MTAMASCGCSPSTTSRRRWTSWPTCCAPTRGWRACTPPATPPTRCAMLRDADVDAVFLDIRMPGLDGMELAAGAGRFAHPPAVVFVTAYDDRAAEAFDLGAVDYVLKPVRERPARRVAAPGRRARPPRARGARSQDRSQDRRGDPGRARRDHHLVRRDADRLGGGPGRLRPAAHRDRARTWCGSRCHARARWADAGFVRVHRSYLVSLSTGHRRCAAPAPATVVCLRAVGASPAVELPVSRRHTRELKDRLVRATATARVPAGDRADE